MRIDRRAYLTSLGLATLAVLPGCRTVIPAAPYTPDGPGSRAHGDVQVFGAPRRGEAAYRIDDARASGSAFGVGLIAGQRGEVTLVDGDAWLAYGEGDAARVTNEVPSDEQASFLILAHVGSWRSSRIERATPLGALGDAVERAARDGGMELGGPLPFQIRGPISSVRGHVAGSDTRGGGGRGERRRRGSESRFELDQADARLVGFLGVGGGGARLGDRMHVHVIVESSRVAGHLDDVIVDEGAELMLPVR